jgi:hypothetical protein
VCSTRSHILTADSSPLRRNELHRQKLGLDPIEMLKTISLFLNWNLKHLNTCLKKKVFYSFDSFHVAMHQVLNLLISVDYILNSITSKILLLQA